MRLLATVATLCAVVVSVSAANNAISVPAGQSTLDVTAGTDLTIQWTNPSPGTVTIKLQQDPISPDGGITLAEGIPASDETATLTIPPANEVNSHVYTIEIIDDTDTSNINFSPNFGIEGATGTASVSASTVSATGTASSGSSSVSNATATGSTSTGSTESSAATTSGSTSTGSTASSSASTTGSETSSSAPSSTSSSAGATQSTSVPDSSSNGAGSLRVQGGLIAAAVGMIAVM